MSDYKSYFNSYARKSPASEAFLKELGYTREDLDDDMLDRDNQSVEDLWYEIVTKNNYPKLYEAIKDECEFRKIDMPFCYMDHTGKARLGYASQCSYSFYVEPAAYEIMNRQELRALVAHEIKHLYQAECETLAQSLEHEYDCDRAAVESVGYKTIQSYVRKAADLQIKRMISNSALQTLAMKFNTDFLIENFAVKLDKWHPSPASRMKAMRKWEGKLSLMMDAQSVPKYD